MDDDPTHPTLQHGEGWRKKKSLHISSSLSTHQFPRPVTIT
jgi:hypothetical protein